MFLINLFQPSPNALVLICQKKKKRKKKPLSQTEASPHCGPSSGGAAEHLQNRSTRRQDGFSLIMLTFVLRLCYSSFAIDASDQSAFCKRQLAIYNMPSIQKKASGALIQGNARVPVNTVSDWASLFKERILVPGCVHWTLLPPQSTRDTESLRTDEPLQMTGRPFFRRCWAAPLQVTSNAARAGGKEGAPQLP